MPSPFYITTAIDYANGSPHLGHAYEEIVSDVIARARRSMGEEVFFLTLLCYMTMNVFVAVSRGVTKYVNKAVTK